MTHTYSIVLGGHATRSSTCSGGMDVLAIPITPSRTVTMRPRMPKPASATALANSYSLLGDDEVTVVAAATLPPPCSPDHQAMAHGWDAFVDSMAPTKKGEISAIDEILILYANFSGNAFRAFEAESEKVMVCITAMEDALDNDRDEIVQTRGNLTKLEEIVLANAQGICDLRAMMRENVTTVVTLQRMVDETSNHMQTMTEALRMVMETATDALQLALSAQPTITGHGVCIDALVDDVSKMSSDIDDLRASNQLAILEGTVSRIDSEFVALRQLLDKRTVPAESGDSCTLPTDGTSVLPDEENGVGAHRTDTQDDDGH